MSAKLANVTYSGFKGPFGPCFLARTDKGLCAFSVRGSKRSFLEQFDRHSDVSLVEVKDCMPEARRQILEYFSGRRQRFELPLDLFLGTPFQQKAWRGLCRIPFGKTRSYGWLAGQTGKPSAARAVGQANGKNPIPVIVPCHRVIAADGSIGGFSGGLGLKRKLLALEGIVIE